VIGHDSEERVKRALFWLKDQGKIDEVKRSPHLDMLGTDAVVRMGSKNYRISVKSSDGGVIREKEAHPQRYRHEDIIFIIPEPGEKREVLGARILDRIRLFEEEMHRH
jgi:hypothetical protein